MFGFRKAPPPKPASSGSDTEPDKKTTITPDRRTSSEPVLQVPKSKGNYFDDDDDDDWGRKPSSRAASKDGYKNGFRDSGGLENQSVQELENYAVYKSEETTKSVNNCLRIAEDIREDASRTLDMLHQQGEQITRTHEMVVDTEKDLSRVCMCVYLSGFFKHDITTIQFPYPTPNCISHTCGKIHTKVVNVTVNFSIFSKVFLILILHKYL